MIPSFPIFKRVAIADRAAVEAHARNYPPYSDFNFTSLWAWDIRGERMISDLNGNLVVRFTDYSSHQPFLSFLGIEQPENTAKALIEFAARSGFPLTLRLVPETSARHLQSSTLRVEPDEDNFDYVYSIADLVQLRGKGFMSKRGNIRRFMRRAPDAHLEPIALDDSCVREGVFSVLASWERSKIERGKDYEIKHERAAIERLCNTARYHRLIVTGLFAQGSMLGFSIEESLPGNHVICHFWKADSSHDGAFDFLMHEKAKRLQTIGVEFLNFEQDLGNPALRRAKRAWRPAHYLKKYTVSLA